MACTHRKWIHKFTGTTVIVCTIALVLFDLFAIWTRDSLAHGIAREPLRPAIHQISLVPIL